MCCFTGPVRGVYGTRIFARGEESRQLLAYQMSAYFKSELAMVLPLPVPAGAGEDALRFIDLSGYPELFEHLARAFPARPIARDRAVALVAAAPPKGVLEVVEVGSFEASFVPTRADFARLDERFRLPEAAWAGLQGHERSGFAVFKLKPGARLAHAMAFDFPRADPARLFFPTIHVHDGQVHERADFDHQLYFQLAENEVARAEGMDESPRLAGFDVSEERSRGLVLARLHLYRRTLRGRLPNRDTLV